MHKITHIVDEQELPESWILLFQGKPVHYSAKQKILSMNKEKLLQAWLWEVKREIQVLNLQKEEMMGKHLLSFFRFDLIRLEAEMNYLAQQGLVMEALLKECKKELERLSDIMITPVWKEELEDQETLEKTKALLENQIHLEKYLKDQENTKNYEQCYQDWKKTYHLSSHRVKQFIQETIFGPDYILKPKMKKL